MEYINKDLKEYIENEIFPIYEKNDAGHNIEHINYVIERCMKFAPQFKNINLNMLYTIASFHDIAHHIDKDNHEKLSASIFYEDENMKKFFNEEERKIIKEAIEDHRASLEYEPRSNYGKIVSSADRTTSINTVLMRTHSYTMKHYKDLELIQIVKRAYNYIQKKYGNGGYSKNYCYDEDYEQFKIDIDTILKNKWLFTKKYMDVNKINDIKEKAKLFAILAHNGQVRKNEPEKPMIIHPIGVGKLLEYYGYDDNVVAAGYLHDVVEDTKYLIDDIKMEFGDDIADLVMVASEPDKSLSWEERKKHTIKQTKTLPLRKKLVICADKINNLEDLIIKFEKTGIRDFSKFNRGEDKQKWYYTSIYESLIYNEDENLPIFNRLKNILDKLFNNKENLFLKETIFNDDLDYYEKLKRLHAKKEELQRLRALCTLSKPFVIEFTGTPRTGKTTLINNLCDFFKKGGFNTQIIEEFTTSKYYKEELKDRFKHMSSSESNIAIIECVYQQLIDAIKNGKDIILIDRSLNDRQIWNYRRYKRGDMDKSLYLETKEKYSVLSKELIDFLVITYADALVSLKRDYYSSLALENRSFLNIDNIDEYNQCLNSLINLFNSSVDDSILVDTTNKNMNDISTEVADNIMTSMRKKYINSFKNKYNLGNTE